MADLTTLLSKFLTDLYAGIFGIPLGAANTYLVSPSANVIEQRNGTSAQTFRIYNTYANGGTDYERMVVGLSATDLGANTFGVAVTKGGTGTNRPLRIANNTDEEIRFATNSFGRWIIRSTGHLVAAADNTYDIGVEGSARPRNAYVAGYYISSVGNALTATGNNRATALQLAAQVNNVTTAAASTGVLLPVGVVGMRVTVFNNGANPVQVYGSASETIDGTAGATGVPLTNALRADFFFVAANTWLSAQLGVVSA